ncbi:MAG: hypothetical protein COB02_14360 [Candidatus Cloacimonadota bacterium]|nr:MAG: hypothetical protein COB02_14360 [Candidatus Cloacimonadota bacterium]
MKQLQFEKLKDIKIYLLRWIRSCPELLSKEIYASRDGLEFCLDTDIYNELDLFLDKGVQVNDLISIPKNYIKSPLWSLYELDKYTKKEEILYVSLYENFVKDFLLQAFKLEHFDIDLMKLDEGQVLLKVNGASHYLFYTAQESYGAKVFWKDDFDTFTPWKSFHPCSLIWSRDTKIRFILDRAIMSVKSLIFQNVFKIVDWSFSFNEEELSASEDLPKIVIPVLLKKSKDYEKPSPVICFYKEDRLEDLENWITEMSPEERRSYAILSIKKPQKGFFVKLKHWQSDKTANFLPTEDSFYLLYEDYSAYCPIDDKLFPNLPKQEFDRLFPIPFGESLLLWNINNECTKIFMSDSEFKELDSIVHYILGQNSIMIEKFVSSICLDDYRIGVYEFNPEDPNGSYSNESISSFENIQIEIEDEEINLQEVLGSTEESVEDKERELIEKRIIELREDLMNSPKKILLKSWYELAGLESKLDNNLESYKLFEVALYFSLNSDNFKPCLNKISDLIKNKMDVSFALDDIFSLEIDKLSLKSFEYCCYVLLNDFDGLIDKQKRFVKTEFLLELESRISQMTLLSLINISSLFHKTLDLDSYLMLKVKDEFLGKLYDKNIFELANLPKFVEEFDFDSDLGTSEETVSDFYSSLTGYFSDENVEVVQNKIFYYLIFALGFARSNNTDASTKNLSKCKNLVSYTNDSLHALFYLYYKKEVENVLYSVENKKVDEKILEIRDQLSSTEKYKAQRLIELSRIVSPEITISTNEMHHEYIGLEKRSPEDLIQAIPTVISELTLDISTPIDRLSYKKKLAFVTILDLLPKLGQDFCLKTFHEIYLLYPSLISSDHKGSVLARLLSIACFYEDEGLINELLLEFETLLSSIENQKPKVIFTLLLPIFDQLSKRITQEQLVPLLEKFNKQLDNSVYSAKIRVLMAVVYDDLLMPDISKSLMKDSFKIYFSGSLGNIESYELFCLMMDKLFYCSLGLKKWVGDSLVRKYSKIKDHYSTNSHFSLSKVAALEFLVHMFEEDEDMSIELKNYFIEFEHTVKNNLFKILRKWEVV